MTKGLLLTGVLFMVMGCTILAKPTVKTKLTSRQNYVNSHSELSDGIKQAIIQAKVIKGMTKEEVLATWGKPSRVSNSSTDPRFYEKDEEGWEYNRLLAIPIFISFKNGIVENIDDSLK